MPLELWVQGARLGLRIVEMPVPLIYLDETAFVRRVARRRGDTFGRVSPRVGARP